MVALVWVVLLCLVGAITGARLVSREVMDAGSWGLVGLWVGLLVLGLGVLWRGRKGAGA